jgi:uncharacterized protein (UPF0332 family)
MPSEANHLASARNNEEFAEFLLTQPEGRFLGWAVSSVYYAAVHYGRAYLRAKGGPTITSHPGFETHFVRISGDQSLYELYRYLKDESERARYDCATYTKAEVSELRQKFLIPFRDAISTRPV